MAGPAGLRGDTPKPFLPYADIRCHIVKVYLKTIRFDTLEIIFENTLFRKKKIFFFEFFKNFEKSVTIRPIFRPF